METRELLAIAQSPIFKGIDIEELQKILTPHHPTVKKFQKGETVWFQDQILDKLIIVIDGLLKAQMTSEEGKVISMEEFPSYQPVAIPVLLSKEKLLPVTLYTVKDSEVFFLEKEMLLSCCMANRTILENTMEVMSQKTAFLSQKIKFLQLTNIKQKISLTLISLSRKNNSLTFKLNMTKEELAKDMGVTRPSLSREFVNLVQKGIISQTKDTITILDLEQLKDYK